MTGNPCCRSVSPIGGGRGLVRGSAWWWCGDEADVSVRLWSASLLIQPGSSSSSKVSRRYCAASQCMFHRPGHVPRLRVVTVTYSRGGAVARRVVMNRCPAERCSWRGSMGVVTAPLEMPAGFDGLVVAGARMGGHGRHTCVADGFRYFRSGVGAGRRGCVRRPTCLSWAT